MLWLSGSRLKPGVLSTVAAWAKYSDYLGRALSVIHSALGFISAFRSGSTYSFLNPLPAHTVFVAGSIERRSPSRLAPRTYRHPRTGTV